MAKMPKLRILHADDDESFRLLVRTMFESDETLTALRSVAELSTSGRGPVDE